MTNHETTPRAATTDHEAQREQVHVGAGDPHAHRHSAPSGHQSRAVPIGHAGHGGHGDQVQGFRRLFWTMLVLAVPVVALSPLFAMLLGYEVPTGGVLGSVPSVLGTILYAWGGSPFRIGAVSERGV